MNASDPERMKKSGNKSSSEEITLEIRLDVHQM